MVPMRLATICSTDSQGPDLSARPLALLPVQPTRRRYPLLEFLRASPLLRSDIAFNSPGVPLSLCLRLHDAGGRAIHHAAVYIWHHDAHGWTFDPRDDEIGAVTFMRGVQISDARGEVRFQTIYPGRPGEGLVPVYLQVYFNDGQHVFARSDACLVLPECHIPQTEALLAAPAAPATSGLGSFPSGSQRNARLLAVDHLHPDADTGGVSVELQIGVALDATPAGH
jgi:hypothetical protein